MTTKPDYRDRIKYHKTEAKPNNIKFDTIRKQTDRSWKYGLLNQWQKPFNDSNEGLEFLAPYEQYYIKRYNTFNTTFGLNNSIGGDYGEGKPNTSGIEGLAWSKDKRKKSKGFWLFKNNYVQLYNTNLRFLLYQVQDQYKQKINILNKKKLKKSLQISDEYEYNDISTRHKYYCGSPRIIIAQRFDAKKGYIWGIDYRNINGSQYRRIDTFDTIKDFGHEIYTPILFAYQAIGLENEWLINNYTVDQSKFMPFDEFEKKYTIKDQEKMKKIILDNLI